MADPYVGEIRMFASTAVPQNWALCNGQVMNISQYQALYAVLGNAYGGDGVTTFRLPDLRGRMPMGTGLRPPMSAVIGLATGESTHTLLPNEMPAHTHVMAAGATTGGTAQASPIGALPSAASTSFGPVANAPMTATTPAGSTQSHENTSPYLGMSFLICLNGIFPSRS